MAAATQKNRLLGIKTPLGNDVLLLQNFNGREGLSQLFSFDIEMLSEKKHDINHDDIVGQSVTVELELHSGDKRYFNGIVNSFVQTAVGRNSSDEVFSSYRATVVPWLWLLTRTANCRIFQEMTVPDILNQIFGEYGFGGFVEDKLSASYRTWEYCVQYRETAFNFVSRLMEQEGIYYYFTHEDGKHMLVLSDSAGAHQPFPGGEFIPFRPNREDLSQAGHIQDWTIGKTLQSGKFTHTDYNFKNPRTPMLVDPFSWPNSEIPRQHQHAQFEVFDYPGEFVVSAEGDQYAKVRAEELQARHEIETGSGTARVIAPGYTFSLTNHPRPDQNRLYLVIEARYSGAVASYSTGGGDDGEGFSTSFCTIPADVPYRSTRQTPKPTIQGLQTAVVSGPDGEEIHTDEFGRVKVQFHWDREHEYDATSSCWIRVAQMWAGKKYGAVFTPRIGQEVVVSFLEGDPDHPLIVGSVYNDDQQQHYSLPGEKTKSYIKSNSSPGGSGYNELRFEDKADKEQIFIHAQKNMDIRVENEHKELIEDDCHITVNGERREKIDRNQSLTVGGSQYEKVDKDHALEAGNEIHLIAGQKVIIEAGVQLTLKGPGGFVDIGPGGVTVSGVMVLINSGGSAGSGSGSKPKEPKEPSNSETGQQSL